MNSRDELSRGIVAYGGVQGADGARKEYANPDFWEKRFEGTEGLFDWYATYEELNDTFEEFCPVRRYASGDLLVVGCGNSAFSAELHAAGYQQITSIDISAAAIRKMQKHFDRPGLTWQTMDATSMTFEDDRFDLAVDKGTLDAMMSAGDQEHTLAGALLMETWRVLKPSGLLILVSHSGKRMKLLRSHGSWRCIELRRCRLSPQATFINMLRSKLPLGAPLKDAFQQPQLLQEASQEAKDALRRMAFIDAFRIFKARKKAQMGEDRMEAEEEDLADAAEQNEDNVPSDPRRQPFCWVYVLRKVEHSK